MAIATIYRVSVDMPCTVESPQRESRHYQDAVRKATEGALHSGSNTYGETEEWAEFDNRPDALRCEAALVKLGLFYA